MIATHSIFFRTTSFFLLGLVLIIGCSPSVSEKYEAELWQSEEGVFRSVKAGMTLQDVKEMETALLQEEKEDRYLQYIIDIGESDSCVLRYNFIGGKLYNMLSETYFRDEELAREVVEQFRERASQNFKVATAKDPDGDAEEVYHFSGGRGEDFEGELSLFQLPDKRWRMSYNLGHDFLFFDRLIQPATGLWRGLEMGQSLEEVLENEPAKPEYIEEDYLYYTLKQNQNDTYAFTYSFDKNGLYEILSEIYFPQHPEYADITYSRLSDFLSDRYGDPAEDEGKRCKWVIPISEFDEFEVELSNETELHGLGRVTLTFFDWEKY